MCSLSIFRLEFPARGLCLYPLAKVPAESGLGGAGPGALSSRVAFAIGGMIEPL